jgi:hypothetical protein
MDPRALQPPEGIAHLRNGPGFSWSPFSIRRRYIRNYTPRLQRVLSGTWLTFCRMKCHRSCHMNCRRHWGGETHYPGHGHCRQAAFNHCVGECCPETHRQDCREPCPGADGGAAKGTAKGIANGDARGISGNTRAETTLLSPDRNGYNPERPDDSGHWYPSNPLDCLWHIHRGLVQIRKSALIRAGGRTTADVRGSHAIASCG